MFWAFVLPGAYDRTTGVTMDLCTETFMLGHAKHIFKFPGTSIPKIPDKGSS